ncbi:MAG: outer membrane beta-barrel protein [Prevotellaceae bacterium]|jgi:long-chain fatty acid transport protein|nr:outer membrane beta-barrel protein [Prevotellaceae bacterium]
MKKVLLSIAAGALCATAFAGGLLTNTNQNVHFLRNPARDASTEIDAVYSNPAGLSFLENDGLTLSLNNQSAFQTRTVSTTFAPFAMNGGSATKEYEGKAKAWFIPSLQAAYKLDKWVFSGSFAVVGGGGTLKYDNGLPSFEALVVSQIAEPLTQLSQASGVPAGYSLDMNLEGSSITYGVQLGVNYKINDIFSAFVGGRISIVKNGYDGYLRNVQITNATALKNYFTNAAAQAQAAADKFAPYVGTYGSFPLSAAVGANLISAEEFTQLAAGLGMSEAEAGALTVAQAQSAFTSAAAQAGGAAAGVTQLENGVSNINMEIETKQSGWGIAPILGVDVNYEKLNIGLKYEFKTNITLENDTKKDNTGMFLDKGKTPYDIPALLTAGLSYKFLEDKLIASVGYHLFFDKDADMQNDKQTKLDVNSYEATAGLEYRINKMFLVSAGGQISRYGLTDGFQSDMSFNCNSYSVGLGGEINITEKLSVNLAYLFTKYADYTQNNPYGAGSKNVFARTNNSFGIGLDYKF